MALRKFSSARALALQLVQALCALVLVLEGARLPAVLALDQQLHREHLRALPARVWSAAPVLAPV